MHATLKFGEAVIMASDSMPGQEVKNGNSIRLSISAQNLEEAERIFNNLSRGGKITMPFEKTFWDAQFGMLTDKFGIHWMINCELK
jgi:PhnB protein